jgi:hypothetical protein
MIVGYACPHHGYTQGDHCKECSKEKEAAFNTSKDRLWNYIDTVNFGRPVEISSKRQFDRMCKEKGIVEVSQSDVKRQENPTMPKFKPVPREQIRDCILQEVQDRGKYDKLKVRRR